MLAVLDTNVLLSGLLGRATRRVLMALFAGRFQSVTSRTLIRELTHVLSRPQWRHVLASAECRELLALLQDDALLVTPTRHVLACRDPEDNALLDCALAGRADCLVTGDRDLLVLHPFHGIPILRPVDFLRRIP